MVLQLFMQAREPIRLAALLCAIYVAHSAVQAQPSGGVDDTVKEVEKRSTNQDKREFRPDLGKRSVEDADGGLWQPLKTEREQRSRSRFRGDLGKRRSSFRGDLGKRRFRGDLGKRADEEAAVDSTTAEKRPRGSSFRGDLGKRPFRGDLGKRDDSSMTWPDGDSDEIGLDWDEDGRRVERRYGFRGDLGKRRASFRGDLGK